jgi:hypothetical protein
VIHNPHAIQRLARKPPKRDPLELTDPGRFVYPIIAAAFVCAGLLLNLPGVSP